MKTYSGSTFFFPHSGNRGVILLHAYTGNSNDVRMLGRQLNRAGYSVVGPLFTGHGGDPRQILKQGSPDNWWDDTRMAILNLRDSGVSQIAIFGLSLGGLFATRALEDDPGLVGGGIFASPITTWGASNVPEYFPKLAAAHYRRQGLAPELIEERLYWLEERLPDQLAVIQQMTKGLDQHLDQLKRPFFIAQGGQDEVIDPHSGAQLRDRLVAQGTPVDYHFYPNASHLLTVNTAHRQLFNDVEQYLKNLFEVGNDK